MPANHEPAQPSARMEIKHRWSGAILFSCEMDAEIAGRSYSFRLGFAVKKAFVSGADLSRANLSDADLSRADLSGAYLSGADLSGAKADFLASVLRLPNELEALRGAIIAGKIDGSSYNGECRCLAGTLAGAMGVALIGGGYVLEQIRDTDIAFVADFDSPRERFFTAIRPGDTPENNAASKLALAWTDEAIRIRDMIRASVPSVAGAAL